MSNTTKTSTAPKMVHSCGAVKITSIFEVSSDDGTRAGAKLGPTFEQKVIPHYRRQRAQKMKWLIPSFVGTSGECKTAIQTFLVEIPAVAAEKTGGASSSVPPFSSSLSAPPPPPPPSSSSPRRIVIDTCVGESKTLMGVGIDAFASFMEDLDTGFLKRFPVVTGVQLEEVVSVNT